MTSYDPEAPGDPSVPTGRTAPIGDRPGSEYEKALARLTIAAGHAATDRVEAVIPEVVNRLVDADIRVIVLKGPTTRLRYYAATEIRPVADVDLLVDPARFRRAARVLAQDGYAFVERHGHSDTLRRPGEGADIDLHLTLPFVRERPTRAFATLAAHVTGLRVGGMTVPVLDEPAHVVHLALHAAVNRFDPASRTMDELRRGFDSSSDDTASEALAIATALGVVDVWGLAVHSRSGDRPASELVAELPLWEMEPRVASLRAASKSGLPPVVRWRDLQRMVRLQLGNDAVNSWRGDRGLAPLPPGTVRIGIEKGRRILVVGAQGGKRLLGVRPRDPVGPPTEAPRT